MQNFKIEAKILLRITVLLLVTIFVSCKAKQLPTESDSPMKKYFHMKDPYVWKNMDRVSTYGFAELNSGLKDTILMCYEMLEDNDKSLRPIIGRLYQENPQNEELKFINAKDHMNKENYGRALKLFSELKRSDDYEIMDQSRFYYALIAFSLNNEDEEAYSIFEEISNDIRSEYQYPARDILSVNGQSNSREDSVEQVKEDSLFFGYAKVEDSQVLGLIRNNSEVEDYKYRTVLKVLNDLIMARGDKRSQKPTLVMNNRTKYVAYMNSRTIEIGVENKAYDICASMGADSLNALAVLIGHEIVHYYEKHNWTNNFAKKNQAMETGKTLKEIARIEGLPNETQADYLGGFLGYSAGYNTLGLMPKVLSKLYEGYGLPDTIPGYPTLQEREIISNNSMDLLAELAHIFDMANYLAIIGDYNNARIHYKRVLKDFQSRELYNNVGVVSFLEALSLFEKDEIKYGYPIELDVESRLSVNTRGPMGFAEKKALREGLLREAIDHFDQAITLDDEYAVGYLNLSCAHNLLHETDEAEFYAGKAARLANQQGLEKTLSDVEIIKGIIADQQNDQDLVKSYFTKAKEMGSVLGEINLSVFNDEEIRVAPAKVFGFSSKVERIDDVVLTSFLNSPSFNLDGGDQKIEIQKSYQLYVVKKENSTIYLAHNEEDGSHSSVFITDTDYPGSTVNFDISIGDTETKLSSAENFGPVSRRVGSTKGNFLVYPKKKIMFITDESNRVSQWALYNIYIPE